MDIKLQEGQNTGFIVADPRPTDFVAGAETGISTYFNNPSGNWSASLPLDERQKINGFETDACVTFSHTNNLEIEGDFAIANGLWQPSSVQWLKDNGYIDASGHLNFSDRALAKMSGTTQAGNNLVNVADTSRKLGLVAEADWVFPVDEITASPADAWNIYYAAVPDAVIAKAAEFVKHFTIQYEWVAYPGKVTTMQDFAVELTKSPLQIATAVCAGWNDAPIIQACGAGTQHATTMFAVEPGKVFHIYDHYLPFKKEFADAYTITYAFRLLIAPIIAPVAPTFKHDYTVDLHYGMPDSPEVHALQEGLQTAKDPSGSPFMRAGLFGPYGAQTRSAVARFQSAHGIVDPNPGEHFGPKTRMALTAALG